MKFTKKELKLVYNALRAAEYYEVGLADAWNFKGPEAKLALKDANTYKKLRKKLADNLNIGMKSQLEEKLSNAVLVPLSEIK